MSWRDYKRLLDEQNADPAAWQAASRANPNEQGTALFDALDSALTEGKDTALYDLGELVLELARAAAQAQDDLAAATEENADLRARLHACQELSGVLPMSDNAVKAGRLFVKDLSSRVDGVGAGYPVNFTLSAGAAGRLLDALRPLFGDAGAALKEKK